MRTTTWRRRITPVVYEEGIFVGYRWYERKKIEPLYAFGHGLSYTTFAYSDLKVSPPAIPLDGRVSIEFTVTNTGNVAGSEIVQLYIRDPQAPVPRPEKELKGFTKITVQPGKKQFVRFRLTAKEFAYWDVSARSWRTDAREYVLLIGSSSDRIALEGTVALRSLSGQSA